MSRELEEGSKLTLDWQKLEKAVAGTKGIIQSRCSMPIRVKLF